MTVNMAPRKTDPWKNVRLGLTALAAVMVVGTGLYMVVGLGVFDAFYQTLITVTTVGFTEVGEQVGTGYRLVTSIVIVVGVGVALYTMGSAFEAVMEGHLNEHLGRTRMQHTLDLMTRHIVVCGWGQVGQSITGALLSDGGDVVVIDRRDDLENETGVPAVVGDATDDEVLRRAGVERARGVIIALDSDAACTYVALSCRALNPGLFIVARANGPDAEPKLRQAGADRVVNPHAIGGARMASLMTQPNVADFLGEAMHDGRLSVQLREFSIQEDSSLEGMTLETSGLVDATGVTVLAIKRSDGTYRHHPDRATELEVGDIPIVLGTAEQLYALRVWLS